MRTATINFSPRPAQLLILRRLELYRFVVAVCHRRLGKTMLAVNWLIKEAFESGIKDYRGYYFCNTQKQAKIVAWQYFKNALEELSKLGLVVFNETELRVDLPNGGKIYLGSAESIENYRGIYIDRIILDEIASWKDAKYAYEEVLRPAMADRQAHALIIGTVKGLNQFYNFYQFGISADPSLEDWMTIDLKVSVTNIIPDKELKMLQATMDSGAYEREFENNFYAEVPDVLITSIEAMEAMKRVVPPEPEAFAPVIVGIDIGLTGDPSTIAIRQGRIIRTIIEIPAIDPMITASKISQALKRITPAPTTVYGDAGQGMAVLSRLRDLGHNNVIDVFFGGASDIANCFNKRSAMAYRFKQFLGTGQIPHNESLLQEMVNQYLEDDPNNKVRLIKKRRIREIIGRSPDNFDCCCLTFAEPDEDQEDTYEKLKHTGLTVQEMSAYNQLMAAREQSQQSINNQYDPMDYFNKQDIDTWT